MPESATLSQVAALAAQLPPDERRQLAEKILHELSSATLRQAAPARRAWREIRGCVSHPLLGEDAQAWVSRTRHEADARREQLSEHAE